MLDWLRPVWKLDFSDSILRYELPKLPWKLLSLGVKDGLILVDWSPITVVLSSEGLKLALLLNWNALWFDGLWMVI